MAIQLNVGGQIPNYPQAWQGVANKPSPQYENASKGIHRLEYSDLWRDAGTILNEGGTDRGGIRIDVQNPPADGGANVQVQLNGFKGHTSVAHVLVASGLGAYAGKQAERNVIISKVKWAFFESLNQGVTVTVTGTP